MITLKDSGVLFDSGRHTYHLDGIQLQGITGVIKEKLFPDEYAGVSDEVLRKAAERGHAIHSALMLFDEAGIETDGSAELATYKAERDLHGWMGNHVASEYLVTDGFRYASAIDKVYGGEDNESVILADIKTTYKLNEEYVSWQLSVYAEMFEAQNPGLKVSALYAIWVRGDKGKVVEVQRKSAEQVSCLLYGDTALQRADEADADSLPAMLEAERKMIKLKEAYDSAAAAYERMKDGIQKIMRAAGAKKYEGRLLTVTRTSDSERETFDTKRFKAENAELYKKYVRRSVSRGTIRIAVKETAGE